MRLLIFATLLVATIVAAENKSYTGYKLVRVTVPNKEQMDYITNLENTDPAFDLWNVGKVNGETVATIMLSPRAYYQYKKAFGKRNLKFELINNNVQEMFDYQEQNMELAHFKGTSRNIVYKFARYSEIQSFVKDTNAANPTITKTYVAGKSVEGRDLTVITFNVDGAKKKVIWIDCGIHAREWVTPATCVYIIDNFVNGWKNNDPEIVALLNKYEFHILPLYNPDGYEYSHASDRMWRKNRKKHTALCTGTDLNRNADYYWNTVGVGSLCIQDNYAGPSVSSEPETQAVASALTAIGAANLQAYYTIHSYGNWWLLPYGHDASLDAPNLAELLQNGNLAAQAIKNVHNENFTVGKSSALLYVTSGTTSDWAYLKFGIPISVTVELRPGADSPDSSYGFKLPEDRLPQVTVETWAGLKASIQHVAQNH